MSKIQVKAKRLTDMASHNSADSRNIYYLCKMMELLCEEVESLKEEKEKPSATN